VWKSAARVPEARGASARFRRVFDSFLDQRPELETELLGLLGQAGAALSTKAIGAIDEMWSVLCTEIARRQRHLQQCHSWTFASCMGYCGR
jgi:hypothetical protein